MYAYCIELCMGRHLPLVATNPARPALKHKPHPQNRHSQNRQYSDWTSSIKASRLHQGRLWARWRGDGKPNDTGFPSNLEYGPKILNYRQVRATITKPMIEHRLSGDSVNSTAAVTLINKYSLLLWVFRVGMSLEDVLKLMGASFLNDVTMFLPTKNWATLYMLKWLSSSQRIPRWPEKAVVPISLEPSPNSQKVILPQAPISTRELKAQRILGLGWISNRLPSLI